MFNEWWKKSFYKKSNFNRMKIKIIKISNESSKKQCEVNYTRI